MYKEITDLEEFKNAINQDKLVLVDFWAEWCGPCRTIAPVFEKLSNEHPNTEFIKVNVDNAEAIAQEVGVRAMPTFTLFKNGNKLDEVVGANPAALVNLIQKHQ